MLLNTMSSRTNWICVIIECTLLSMTKWCLIIGWLLQGMLTHILHKISDVLYVVSYPSQRVTITSACNTLENVLACSKKNQVCNSSTQHTAQHLCMYRATHAQNRPKATVTTVCTLRFRHSNCSSPEPKRCDCLLNDDVEWRILIPRCTF